jgi:phosphoribosylformimino-5-aminoimidazole carboxamide ribonucleotide (ProFAR) isomerase
VSRLVSSHPERVAVGLDHWDGEVRVRGWEERSGRRLFDVVCELVDTVGEGLAAFVVTDIARDGALAGPDLAGYEALVGLSPVPIVASGGVSELDDLRALRSVGVGGVIVGKALYEGRFTVEEAVAACGA